MEAFVHYIKFAPEDSRREGISKLTGGKAKRAAGEFNDEIRAQLAAYSNARTVIEMRSPATASVRGT